MPDYNLQGRRNLAGLPPQESLLALARYVVVGSAQNVFFYGLTLGLLWFKFKAWQATAFLYPVAVAVTFRINRSWSFGNRGNFQQQFRNYVLVYAGAYPLSIAFTWLQEHLGIPSWLASLGTMAVAALGIFFALNYWVFGKAAIDEGST